MKGTVMKDTNEYRKWLVVGLWGLPMLIISRTREGAATHWLNRMKDLYARRGTPDALISTKWTKDFHEFGRGREADTLVTSLEGCGVAEASLLIAAVLEVAYGDDEHGRNFFRASEEARQRAQAGATNEMWPPELNHLYGNPEALSAALLWDTPVLRDYMFFMASSHFEENKEPLRSLVEKLHD